MTTVNTDHTANLRPLPRKPLFTLIGAAADVSGEVSLSTMGTYFTRVEAEQALTELPAGTGGFNDWNVHPLWSREEVLTGTSKTIDTATPDLNPELTAILKAIERQQEIDDFVNAGGTPDEVAARWPEPGAEHYLPGGIFDGSGSTLPDTIPAALADILDAEPDQTQGQALMGISYASMVPVGRSLGELVEEAALAIAADFSAEGAAISKAVRNAELETLPDVKRYAVLAVAARKHILPEDAFTPTAAPAAQVDPSANPAEEAKAPVSAYEWLLAPWVSVMGQVHPDDAVRSDWIK